MTGEAPNPGKISKLEENMAQCLDNIETLWLSQGKYIAGDHITVADIVAATEIEQPRNKVIDQKLAVLISSLYFQAWQVTIPQKVDRY